MPSFFKEEGWLFTLTDKVGETLLATIYCVLCCIPLVTVIPSLTSFYYVMVKCVRHDRSSVTKEFFGSMKRVFVRGLITSILLILWLFGLYYNGLLLVENGFVQNNFSPALVLIYVLIAVTLFIAVWIPPVFSRFDMKLTGILRMAAYVSFRYFYITILIAALDLLGGFLVIRVLPVLFIFVVPGACAYLSTYLVERVLIKVMPESDDNPDQWYRD